MFYQAYRTGRLGLMLAAGLELVSQTAQAQSPTRIPERTASDSGPPGMEDFAAFLAADVYENNASLADNAKVIKSLKGLLGRSHVNSTTRFKLQRRLADAYRQKADAEHSEALKKYREAYRAWQEAGEGGEAPRFAAGAAGADMLKAVATYRQYMSDYAKADGMPAQRLALAILLGRLGDENAELYLRDLIKGDAPPAVIQVAKLGLAEVLIAKNQPAAAVPLLVEVGSKGTAALRPWARYRLGWTLALGSADGGAAKAADLWMQVARLTAHAKDAGSDYSLAAAARQDLVALWAKTAQDKAALAYFAEIKDAEDGGNTLARMGYLNTAESHPVAAIQAYEALRQAFPRRGGMCVIELRLTALYDGQKDYPHAAGALAAMISSCQGPAAHTDSPSRTLLARTLYTYGTNYYQQGVKEHDVLRLKAANVAFRGFLVGFPQQSTANDVRFALADVLDRLGDKAQAAREYFTVAHVEAGGAPLRHDASLHMLALQKEVAAGAPAAPAAAPGALPKPAVLPPAKAFLVDVIDAFRKYVPDAPNGPAEALTAAMIEFDYGHYSAALPRLSAVVSLAPRAPEADSAAHTALAYYQMHKEWDHMIAASQTYLKQELSVPLAGKVTAYLRTGMWERAASLEHANRAMDATTAYLAFQARFPADPEADLALRQAMNLQRLGGHGAPCLKTAEMIYTDYRASSYRPEALRTAGDINEQRAEFEAAALDYLALANDYPQDAKAPEALSRVGELYAAAENNSSAAAALEQLATTFRSSPYATPALFKSAKLHDEQNDAVQAIADYSEYVRRAGSVVPDQALFAETRAATLSVALGGTAAADAQRVIAVIEAKVTALPPGQAVLARNELARFRLEAAGEGLDEISERDLATSSLTEFKTSCDKLVAAVSQRELKLAAIEHLKSPVYGGAAAFARGELNEIAAGRLRLAEFSTGLEAADAYEMGKLKERLLLTYQRTMLSSYKAAASAGAVPSAWRLQAQAKLSHVDPTHFAGASERLLSPTFVDHNVSLPTGGAEQ